MIPLPVHPDCGNRPILVPNECLHLRDARVTTDAPSSRHGYYGHSECYLTQYEAMVATTAFLILVLSDGDNRGRRKCLVPFPVCGLVSSPAAAKLIYVPSAVNKKCSIGAPGLLGSMRPAFSQLPHNVRST